VAHYYQPVLIEAFLPGREITVGIAGTGDDAKIIGVMEVLFNEKAKDEIYSFFNKENYKEVVKYRLVQDAFARKVEEIALAAWRGLGCKDAGRVDLREDAQGIPNFLEINPLAGLHPENSDLPILSALAGIGYPALIEMIMESAMKRIGIKDTSLVKSIFA
jgi:D-alanine-D-alanine ligase